MLATNFRQHAVKTFENITTTDALKVDVYVPSEDTPAPSGGRPVFFFIHGGAWHLGSKSTGLHPSLELAQEGYVTVSSSYRLAKVADDHMHMLFAMCSVVFLTLAFTASAVQELLFLLILMVTLMAVFSVLWLFDDSEEVSHPMQIMDIAHNFKWVCEHIHEYGGDPNNIVLIGHSAGGHLASLLATNQTFLTSIGGDPTMIKACIGISGVYSDQRMQNTHVGRALLASAFGKREQYYDAFPIYNVGDETPPFLLINTPSDLSLQYHTTDLHYALRQKQIYSKVFYSADRNHFNICMDWDSDNRQMFELIHEFRQELDQYHMRNQRAQKGV